VALHPSTRNQYRFEPGNGWVINSTRNVLPVEKSFREIRKRGFKLGMRKKNFVPQFSQLINWMIDGRIVRKR
jgi:hypothetical protein